MSTRYRITTPVPDFSGEVGNCAFAKGVYEGPVEPGPLGYFCSQGYGVEDLDAETVEEAEAKQTDELPDLPAKSAPKADWVAAAVARGIDAADAEKATKEQLVELLNTPNNPPAPEEQN